MKILYINHYAGSPHHGMEYRPYYLATNWVKQGHQVAVVAANYSHLRHKNIDISNNNKYKFESIDGIDYIWCNTPKYNGNGLKRLINIFTYLYRLFKFRKHLITQFKPDVVIASSTYPFDTVIAKYIARKSQAKFIYEIHDLWPLTLIELSGMSKYHPLIMLMQLAENYGYKKCDKVVSLLPNANEYMFKHGLAQDKFIYIPNGIELANLTKSELPNSHFKQIQAMKTKYKYLLGYAGGMGESNALEYLLDAIKLMPSDQSIGFVLVGDGNLKEDLIKQTANDDRVLILPPIDKNQVQDFLSYMDVLYIGWHDSPIYRFGISPNKIFDYMLSKKPILHSVNASNDLVKIANCGVSVRAQDPVAIRDGIKQLINLGANNREILGINGYNYVCANHDYQILARKFLQKI